MHITIHGRAGCPHCDRAKAQLDGAGIPYAYIAHDDLAERQAFYDRLGLRDGARTVPQCVLTDDDGEELLIGGARELALSGVESLWATPPAALDADLYSATPCLVGAEQGE